MIRLAVRAPDGMALEMALKHRSAVALLGELRIVSPALADKVQDVIFLNASHMQLDHRELNLLAVAAENVCHSPLIEDPELEKLAQL